MNVIIGLEAHIPINLVDTKIFCGCALPDENAEPNTHTCPVCLAMPGSKPVLNKKVLEYALRLAVALKFDIAKEVIFSRKSYEYPDLPAGFQRTQYEIPLASKGFINLSSGKKINLTRAHVEEDPGSLIHKGSFCLVDYNRAGIPLVEVVTEPEMESPEEAREFLNKLITIVNYLGIYDSAKGPIRADANISIKGHNRVEIKNISGFKEIESALKYEIARQKKELEDGNEIKRETRGWDTDKQITVFQRSKEEEQDYGYITECDLVPIDITNKYLDEIKKSIPELAHEKVERYIKTFKLNKEDAETIAAEYLLADLFEKVAKKIDPILAAKWLRRELIRVVEYNEINLHDLEIDETHLIELLELVDKKQITERVGQKLMEQLIEKPFSPKEYVKQQGIKIVSGDKELEILCKEAIEQNKKAADDYKLGNEKSLFFLSGIIMKKTKGQADIKKVNEILKKLLK
ncbi:MAG: Asp-tRNA(Asn)/Glu-tRNA(Gln) amidotransferase subunit GatB [Nanoarchaeota archaeon]|nr:Asp-tRNA(Asn)/Glu-tRNA(Gln) amidotransferase subunit GatB [Nanoarchaeota archaeon]MBU0962660.1 Asp-tRNA(Asn)/Glu-tRNA(Gln) amidotransferase subunit GatB [Nanoarchaeota archaeon]